MYSQSARVLINTAWWSTQLAALVLLTISLKDNSMRNYWSPHVEVTITAKDKTLIFSVLWSSSWKKEFMCLVFKKSSSLNLFWWVRCLLTVTLWPLVSMVECWSVAENLWEQYEPPHQSHCQLCHQRSWGFPWCSQKCRNFFFHQTIGSKRTHKFFDLLLLNFLSCVWFTNKSFFGRCWTPPGRSRDVSLQTFSERLVRVG